MIAGLSDFLQEIIHTTFTSSDIIRQRVELFQNSQRQFFCSFDGSMNTPKGTEKVYIGH